MRQAVAVCGAFDDLRSPQVRFLQEAARLGPVHVLLWPDEQVRRDTGRPPKFSLGERRYLLEALRYVEQVTVPAPAFDPETLPGPAARVWAVGEAEDSPARRAFAAANALEYRVVRDAELAGFPADCEPESPEEVRRVAVQPSRDQPARALPADARSAGARQARARSALASARPPGARPKVLVTGCFDWFHSGHVRFFEEASALGELYVVVGHDANVRLLKGEGHPLFPQEERRYLVAAVRHVRRALVSSGEGWLDAEPEIQALRPDLYVVNEDGDKPEKRAYCEAHGIGYVVLRRKPREGLPSRQSTDLRGF